MLLAASSVAMLIPKISAASCRVMSFSIDHIPSNLSRLSSVSYTHLLDGVLNAGFADAVPGVELVAAAVHMIAEQPRIHAGRNLGRAGGLSSVADDAGCDRHRCV